MTCLCVSNAFKIPKLYIDYHRDQNINAPKNKEKSTQTYQLCFGCLFKATNIVTSKPAQWIPNLCNGSISKLFQEPPSSFSLVSSGITGHHTNFTNIANPDSANQMGRWPGCSHRHDPRPVDSEIKYILCSNICGCISYRHYILVGIPLRSVLENQDLKIDLALSSRSSKTAQTDWFLPPESRRTLNPSN